MSVQTWPVAASYLISNILLTHLNKNLSQTLARSSLELYVLSTSVDFQPEETLQSPALTSYISWAMCIRVLLVDSTAHIKVKNISGRLSVVPSTLLSAVTFK